MVITQKINVQEIVQCFRESLGQEKAYQLVHNALDRLGMSHLQQLGKEEMIRLCTQLKQEGGFIAVLTDLLMARFNLRN